MKYLSFAVTLAVLIPVAATAAPVVPIVGSAGAGWHAMGAPADPNAAPNPVNAPNTTRDQAYWAGKSYDRNKDTPSGSTACGAGALVMGFNCPYNLGPNTGLVEPIAPATAGEEAFYWGFAPTPGLVGPNFNADPSFYFSGLLEVDLRVLSEMTSWKEGVEIGWYDVNDPTQTTVLIGGAQGIPKDAQGNYVLGGTTSATLNGEYGFYYKNYERGVAFYTQSGLNHFMTPGLVTPYLAGLFLTEITVDDEFALNMFDPKLYQQFALFGQGDKFWLGIEDIFGPTSPCIPNVPCSDYDYNDFLIGGTLVQPPPDVNVPEPTTLTMLAFGLFGAAIALKRRTRLQ